MPRSLHTDDRLTSTAGVLAGRGAVITGASQGLGLAIAHAFVAEGASVYICARDGRLLEYARRELIARASEDQRVGAQVADVADPTAVAQLVEAAHEALGELSILVNNAGGYGPKGALGEVAWEEWVQAIQINLFGSALCARAMLPHLRRASRGKIVQLSGGGATSPMPGLSSYAVSKTGVVRLAETLALELRDDGVDVNALAPGALNTRMLDEILEAGPERVGSAYYERSLEQKRTGGASLENAAALAVWLASSASDGITGKLISAVWDPWRSLSEHRGELESDVYTLRRILPSDREMTWGEPDARD